VLSKMANEKGENELILRIINIYENLLNSEVNKLDLVLNSEKRDFHSYNNVNLSNVVNGKDQHILEDDLFSNLSASTASTHYNKDLNKKYHSSIESFSNSNKCQSEESLTYLVEQYLFYS